jgi:hypothetical protein
VLASSLQSSGTSTFTSSSQSADVFSVAGTNSAYTGNVVTLTMNRPLSSSRFLDVRHDSVAFLEVSLVE